MGDELPMDAAIFRHNLRLLCTRKSHAEIADEFGIELKTLYRWCGEHPPKFSNNRTLPVVMAIAKYLGVADWHDLWRKRINEPYTQLSHKAIYHAYKQWREKNPDDALTLERRNGGMKSLLRRIELELPKLVATQCVEWLGEGPSENRDELDRDDLIDGGASMDEILLKQEQADKQSSKKFEGRQIIDRR